MISFIAQQENVGYPSLHLQVLNWPPGVSDWYLNIEGASEGHQRASLTWTNDVNKRDTTSFREKIKSQCRIHPSEQDQSPLQYLYIQYIIIFYDACWAEIQKMPVMLVWLLHRPFPSSEWWFSSGRRVSSDLPLSLEKEASPCLLRLS